MKPAGVADVDEPARELDEGVLDEILRELPVTGQEVCEPAGVDRMALVQLHEEPALELDRLCLHPHSLRPLHSLTRESGWKVDASTVRARRASGRIPATTS